MTTVVVDIPNTTFVSSAQPTINFSVYPTIYSGNDAQYQNCISLMQIALPALPVSFVDSAVLQLAVIAKSGTNPSPVVVNTVMEPFNKTTVTYNTQPAYTPTQSQVNVTTNDLYKTVEIDVTALVNSWLNGTVANNGLALTNSDGTTVVQFGTNNISWEPYFPKLVLTYTGTPSENSATNFCYSQLSHIIQQIIMFYPTNTVTVFTKGLTASSITGTPYQLFASPAANNGAVFIVMDNGQEQAIPLNSITAIYTGNSTVYNPSFTYLSVPAFTPGYDTDIVTTLYEYLNSKTDVDIYTGSNVHATGTIYKNEYGIVVISDGSGNTPVFIPILPITAIIPATSNLLKKSESNKGQVLISVEKQIEKETSKK
ncbi:DNRLRE domain-containing protein [Ruminiclostridium josui]|uniref:DNRLRE domain-containing protein n=1 Tax=Ruminiclostridium josui TaxID=1499 RepID=UPI0004644B77|nr:DNRLRE domain-containing protein [Ruminiclostridium josui]